MLYKCIFYKAFQCQCSILFVQKEIILLERYSKCCMQVQNNDSKFVLHELLSFHTLTLYLLSLKQRLEDSNKM